MICMRLCLVGLVGLLLAACGTGPHLVVPTPRASDYARAELFAVCGVSPSEVFSVGVATRADGTPEGLILGSSDGGRTWRRLAYAGHDLARVNFTNLWFNDRLRGWVAGVRTLTGGRTVPVIFRTRDGGNRWTEVPLLQDQSALVTSVHGLRFEDDREGRVLVELVDGATGAVSTSEFRTTDGGSAWINAVWRGPLAVPEDPTVSWVGSNQAIGYRLMPTGFPGITGVQKTTSGGQDWVEVARLESGQMDSWWGGPNDQ